MNLLNEMMDAQTEIIEEMQMDKNPHALKTGRQKLEAVLAEVSPLPDEGLFLGIAEDGLPVLLNLSDPAPGPILIAGDQASGKTAFLQMVARAAELLHSPSKIQYGVITGYPEEWAGFQENQVNAGVFSIQNKGTAEFLQSISDWAHNNKGNEQSILLLIDDLEGIKNISPEAEQNLRWLLLRGPSRRVWPIITVNPRNARNAESWLTFFRTRLFGRIQNIQDSDFIAGHKSETINDLTAGSQFVMREGNNWQKFLLPSID